MYRVWSWNKNGLWAMAAAKNKILLGGNKLVI